MRDSHDRFIRKLQKVAEVIAAEKHLYFFGLVQHDSAPPDLWDLLVSAKKLVPWSAEAIKYIVGLLRKELTDDEMVKIAQVVVLPRDHALVAALKRDQMLSPAAVRGLHPADHPDRAVVIWPAKSSLRSMKSA